jgi:activating signal cointegrator 1
MKAATLHQPYASLVAVGAKRIETRHWPTSHRGPIAIHAARRSVAWRPWHLAERMLDLAGHPHHRVDELPSGMVVATATLADVVLTQDLGSIPAREHAFGNFARGRFAWVLEGIRPLRRPLTARGQQSLWEWEGRP